MGRKSVSTLYSEWEKVSKETKELERQLGQRYTYQKMRPVEVALLCQLWMKTREKRRLADAAIHYPETFPFEELVHTPVFEAVVREMARCNRSWPDEAIPALKKYMGEQRCHPIDRTVLQHVLHRLSREDDFDLKRYHREIVSHGTASMCKRLIEDEERRRRLEGEDYHRMVERFRKRKPDYNDRHPLVILASADGIPSGVVEKIVNALLVDDYFRSACKVVIKAKRSDLIPLLEERVLRSTSLHDIRDFLRDFPDADKDKFRDVVRKLIMPDPDEIIDAFLHRRSPPMGRHPAEMMIMAGPPPWWYGGRF
jgi:hypothetical protein